MKVTELIELTNRLTANHSNLTAKERATCLGFLNLANLDLYKVAASGLDTIAKKVKIFINADNVSFNLPADFFMTRTVDVDKVSLTKGALQSRHNTEPMRASYYILGNVLYLDYAASKLTFLTDTDLAGNANRKYIDFIYSPKPLKLVEVVNDATTETDEPVYPEPFHFYLTHGALCYFYFANRVFLEKERGIRAVWENNKQELAQYKNYGL